MSAHCSECGDDLAWDLTCGRCEMTADRDRWKSLALDMGDYLRDVVEATRYGDEPADLLLARLDRIGKEQT